MAFWYSEAGIRKAYRTRIDILPAHFAPGGGGDRDGDGMAAVWAAVVQGRTRFAARFRRCYAIYPRALRLDTVPLTPNTTNSNDDVTTAADPDPMAIVMTRTARGKAGWHGRWYYERACNEIAWRLVLRHPTLFQPGPPKGAFWWHSPDACETACGRARAPGHTEATESDGGGTDAARMRLDRGSLRKGLLQRAVDSYRQTMAIQPLRRRTRQHSICGIGRGGRRVQPCRLKETKQWVMVRYGCNALGDALGYAALAEAMARDTGALRNAASNARSSDASFATLSAPISSSSPSTTPASASTAAPTCQRGRPRGTPTRTTRATQPRRQLTGKIRYDVESVATQQLEPSFRASYAIDPPRRPYDCNCRVSTHEACPRLAALGAPKVNLFSAKLVALNPEILAWDHGLLERVVVCLVHEVEEVFAWLRGSAMEEDEGAAMQAASEEQTVGAMASGVEGLLDAGVFPPQASLANAHVLSDAELAAMIETLRQRHNLPSPPLLFPNVPKEASVATNVDTEPEENGESTDRETEASAEDEEETCMRETTQGRKQGDLNAMREDALKGSSLVGHQGRSNAGGGFPIGTGSVRRRGAMKSVDRNVRPHAVLPTTTLAPLPAQVPPTTVVRQSTQHPPTAPPLLMRTRTSEDEWTGDRNDNDEFMQMFMTMAGTKSMCPLADDGEEGLGGKAPLEEDMYGDEDEILVSGSCHSVI